jgi:superfamily II DNA or RNA helicase
VRHTVRRLETVQCKFDKSAVDKVLNDRWNVFEDRPLRDVSELFLVTRKLVNSDPSRLEAIRALLERHPKAIIFYNFNYELDALRTLSDVTNVAEWNGQKHEPIPLEKDNWIYLVQYTAGAEGWNCTDTNVVIFASQNYSYKIFEQSQGRIDRLDTLFVDLQYYLLMTNSWIDLAIAKKMATKKSFNESDFIAEFEREKRTN